MDYQSEMMRRDINGKLDGNGLKRGDFTEGATTILAPLVVGKVSSPFKAPNSLKSLGALPEIEVTTVPKVVKLGKIIESQDKFSPKEKELAEFLAKEGKVVEKLPENYSLPGRKADALVDGIKTEFKKLDQRATNATLKSNISSSIKKGGQARNMVIDARGTGLTLEEAQRGLARAANITKGRIDSVRVLGDGFDITATKFK
jgi:Contact-dependent growth inhibition CdiA C-terminal domain